jgi:hypothetical protein
MRDPAADAYYSNSSGAGSIDSFPGYHTNVSMQTPEEGDPEFHQQSPNDWPIMPGRRASTTGYRSDDPVLLPKYGGDPRNKSTYARGGAVVGSMPGGYGAVTPVISDPVARRRYTPRHVGFAAGGEVDDPMDYVPDDPGQQQQQQPQQDEFNLLNRKDPQVSPFYYQGDTGYAAGGSVKGGSGLRTASGARVGEVPAQSTVMPADSPANAKLFADMDTIRQRTVNPPPLQMPGLPLKQGLQVLVLHRNFRLRRRMTLRHSFKNMPDIPFQS